MLDKRSRWRVLGNLDQYTKFQTAEAIGDAAKNPGGMAGVGAGLGAGVAIGGADGRRPARQPGTCGRRPARRCRRPGAQFYVGINGSQAGPFDLSALAAKVRSGEITRQSLVWKPGMAAWMAAEAVAELQPLFANVPPPLPPA